jgi:hypothetical protein
MLRPLFLAPAVVLAVAEAPARADEVPATEAPAPAPTPPPEGDGGPRARWHPRYAVELEAHGSIAAFDDYFVGLGGGVRATVPIWSHSPFRGFDNELGVSFGVDAIRYAAYKPLGTGRGPSLRLVAWYVPVALHWSVWLGSRASVFVEPGVIWRFADFVDRCDGLPCVEDTRFLPTGAVGLRFRIVDRVSGTLRVGWPIASLGVSWL